METPTFWLVRRHPKNTLVLVFNSSRLNYHAVFSLTTPTRASCTQTVFCFSFLFGIPRAEGSERVDLAPPVPLRVRGLDHSAVYPASASACYIFVGPLPYCTCRGSDPTMAGTVPFVFRRKMNLVVFSRRPRVCKLSFIHESRSATGSIFRYMGRNKEHWIDKSWCVQSRGVFVSHAPNTILLLSWDDDVL